MKAGGTRQGGPMAARRLWGGCGAAVGADSSYPLPQVTRSVRRPTSASSSTQGSSTTRSRRAQPGRRRGDPGGASPALTLRRGEMLLGPPGPQPGTAATGLCEAAGTHQHRSHHPTTAQRLCPCPLGRGAWAQRSRAPPCPPPAPGHCSCTSLLPIGPGSSPGPSRDLQPCTAPGAPPGVAAPAPRPQRLPHPS